VRQHRSHYADVVSGVTFNPTAVRARWSRQIEMLQGLK
jgi:hypothetical protein